MAEKKQQPEQQGSSGVDRLKDTLGSYLEARGQQAVNAVGSQLTGLTERLNADGGSGDLLGMGKRVLGGESPGKAFLGEKAKETKDKLTGGVKEALGGGSGGSGGGGGTKVTNIIETIDIGLPRRMVYDYWTQLEEFSGFTKGVQSVNMSDEVESDWKVKVAFSDRSWQATIQQQVPDERIEWTSEGAKGSTKGVVSFHEITSSLTRLVVVVEYFPAGFFEKTGNLWRAQGRRLRLDLKHFQRYVTLEAEEEVEGWRGEIRDGEVVLSHEDAVAEERKADSASSDESGDQQDEAEGGSEAQGSSRSDAA